MRALKFAGFTVGQVIRADDFESRPGRGDCYIEGKILEVHPDGCSGRPYAHYVIAIARDVWLGEEQPDGRVGDTGYVPMETMFREWDGRVRLAPDQEIMKS